MFLFLAFSLLLVPPVFFFLRPLAAPNPSLSSRPASHKKSILGILSLDTPYQEDRSAFATRMHNCFISRHSCRPTRMHYLEGGQVKVEIWLFARAVSQADQLLQLSIQATTEQCQQRALRPSVQVAAYHIKACKPRIPRYMHCSIHTCITAQCRFQSALTQMDAYLPGQISCAPPCSCASCGGLASPLLPHEPH